MKINMMMMIIILTIYPFPELHRLLACCWFCNDDKRKKGEKRRLRVSGMKFMYVSE